MRPLTQTCKFLLPLVASSLCFAAQPDRIVGPIDSSRMVELARSLHPKALPQFDQGPVDASMQLSYMTMLMAPSPAEQQALDILLAQQQDRKSANYHKWLTPQQFANQFGLSQRDLNKVIGWLQSEGFQILSVGGGRNSIIFSGTAAQVQHAFGAEIHNYSILGKKYFANSTPLLIPAALNGIVRTVLGVHSFLPHPAGHFRTPRATQSSHPYYYSSEYGNFLAPGDIATIYDINALYNASTPIDGAGQQLAVVGQTDIYLDDINDFRSGFALNPISGCSTSDGMVTATSCNTTYFKYVVVGTDTGQIWNCGDLGESDLDIEWSGAVAQAAQIVFVNAPVVYNNSTDCGVVSGGGVIAALNAVINPPSGPPLAPVVSMSYGACERDSEDLETLLQQGNAEGVTIFNSAGDVGAAECDFNPPNATLPYDAAVGGLAVSYPASSPEVTGVGGTEITIANDFPPSSYWGTTNGTSGGSVLSYIPEIEWNDNVEIAQYCQQYYSGNDFCLQGGSPAVQGWVALEASATAEQVQQDIWLSIAGGGASCFLQSGGACTGFTQPAFQSGLSVADAPAGLRWVPDVSMLASPNFPGYIFCTAVSPVVDGSTCASGIATAVADGSIVGGTSVSSPLLAGMFALLNQYVVSNGIQSTPGLGNINPNLYILAAAPSSAVFNQVTSGTNDVYCQPGTPASQPTSIQCPSGGVLGYSASNFDATTHYNLVAGLGSINANNLVAAWKNLVVADFQLSNSGLSPNSVSAGSSTSTIITIAPISGSTGTVVNFSTSSCTGLPTGATCSFNPASVTFNGTSDATTTLTISTVPNMAIPSGAQTITITPQASPKTTTTVSLTVTPTTESFTLASTNGATFPNIAGQTSQVQIAVSSTSSPSFIVGSGTGATTAVPLTYSCSGSPNLATAEIACTINNNQATNLLAVTAVLTTTGPTTQIRRPFGSGRLVYAFLLPGLFGVVFAVGSRKRGIRLLSMIVVFTCCTIGLGSCGGGGNSGGSGGSNPGTPAGTYTITISATTGGASPLTNSTQITLNVSQ